MTRFDDGPAKGQSLTLERSPLYLRVVVDTGGKADALDQLDDEPKADEALYAYRRVSVGTMHVSYSEGGRRKGHWEELVSYALCGVQPDERAMRDTALWRQWCDGQAKGGKP